MILTGFIGTSGLVFLSQFVAKSCAKSADRQAKIDGTWAGLEWIQLGNCQTQSVDSSLILSPISAEMKLIPTDYAEFI